MSLQSEKTTTVLSLQNIASTQVLLSDNTLFTDSVNSVLKRGICKPRVPYEPSMVIDLETGTPINGAGLMLGTVRMEALEPIEATSPFNMPLYSYGTPQGTGSYANYSISPTAQEINDKFFTLITNSYSTVQETSNAPYFALLPDGSGTIQSGTILVTIEFVLML